MPTVCPGINSLYTQWSVNLLFLVLFVSQFLWLFERDACLFRDKPRLLCRSSPLSLIHKPDGSSSSSTFSFCLVFFSRLLQFEFSSFSFCYALLCNFEFSFPSSTRFSSSAFLFVFPHSFFNLTSDLLLPVLPQLSSSFYCCFLYPVIKPTEY